MASKPRLRGDLASVMLGHMSSGRKRQPLSLAVVLSLGFGGSVIVVFSLIWAFAAYATGELVPWNRTPPLNGSEQFEVIRNAVTTAAALGVGVTLFLSYRRQRTAEATQRLTADALALSNRQHELEVSRRAEDRVRALRERYASAAEQLGSDQLAVAIAGVHILESLADEWKSLELSKDRQDCINLLCSYLRLSPWATPAQRAAKDLIGELLLNRIQKSASSAQYWDATVDLTGQVPQYMPDVLVKGLQLKLSHLAAPPNEDVVFNRWEVLSGRVEAEDMDLSRGNLWIRDSELRGGEMSLALDVESPGSGTVGFSNTHFMGTHLEVPYGQSKKLKIHFTDCTFSGGSFRFGTWCHPLLVTFERCHFDANIFEENDDRKGFSVAQVRVHESCTFGPGIEPLVSHPLGKLDRLTVEIPFHMLDEVESK